MHRTNAVWIRAPRERIFAEVSDLKTWPRALPHYRFVRVLETHPDGVQVVHMAARRSGLPIAWVSEYHADAESCELHFTHLKAWTKGMKVVWTMQPENNGTRVEISHDLRFRIPWLAPVAETVIGGFFIHHVANRTLKTFKELIESK